jgi:murein L,D-transpeptidase YcbB/YkuD
VVPPAAPAPVAAPPVTGEITPDAVKAALAKASASPLFPRLAKSEREAISAYYQAHGFALLWRAGSDAALTPAARAVLDRLAHAAEEGLDPDDYAAGATPPASTRPDDVAEADWRLSAAALAYARDARGARVNPSRLSVLITPELFLPSADQVFDSLARAQDASQALQAFNPHSDGYINLRTALAKLRSEMVAPSPDKSEDTTTVQIASVAPDAIKGRGKVPGAAAKHALPSISPKRVEADIIANMERWRWLPPELGERYILVNVPEFTLRYIDNGTLSHVARVVVGKPTSPTPIFSGEMKFLVVNPSWYIPPSILKKEFLPKLAEDPLYAVRQGYEVVRNGDQISIRQPPGERNALGRIKFMFPNKHSVYLHDTPSRSLFVKAARAFSHGCVRVDQPFRLAEYVLNDKAAWPEKRIEKLIGGSERTISLPRQLPVHLAYFTLAADADGSLHRFGDIYGLDSRLETALAPRK